MFTFLFVDLDFAFLEDLLAREGYRQILMKPVNTYFFDNIGYFSGTKSLLEIASFCDFPFGDVYEDITDLQNIVQICFAADATLLC